MKKTEGRIQRSDIRRSARMFVIVISSLILHPSSFGQGSLTPPGAPAPTMKTLEQVEPRTPISNAVTIAQSGSYYLITNITVSTGTAITIATDNVTLDLNGFSVTSTEPMWTGSGILLSGTRSHIHILNGHIRGNVTYSGGFYTGAGFAYGIYRGTGGISRNVRVTGVSVSGCGQDGIYLGTGNANVVDSCTVHTVGGSGIFADTVTGSVAYRCGSAAINATTAHNSYGYSTSSYGLLASTASNCHGTSDTATGLHAVATASNCRGHSGGSGIGLYANSALNCQGYSLQGDGLVASLANACYGESDVNGRGLVASLAAINCYGRSGGNGDGLQALTAVNCIANSTGGDGIDVTNGIAIGCWATSTTGVGLRGFIANSCWGNSTAVSHKYNMP